MVYACLPAAFLMCVHAWVPVTNRCLRGTVCKGDSEQFLHFVGAGLYHRVSASYLHCEHWEPRSWHNDSMWCSRLSLQEE